MGSETESKRLVITCTGHDVPCKVSNTTHTVTRRHSWAYSVLESPKRTWTVNWSEAVGSNLTIKLNIRCGSWITHTHTSLTINSDLHILGAQVKKGCCIQRAFRQSMVFRLFKIGFAMFFCQFFSFSSQTVHARCFMFSAYRCT